jgi:NADH-quinone oxidoreductase subunit C
MSAASLAERLRAQFPEAQIDIAQPRGEMTLEVAPEAWHATCRTLRDAFGFEQLMDLCGVDYLGYGSDEWDTDVSSEGFSRGVEGKSAGRFAWGEQVNGAAASPERRFAVVLHLLSYQHNRRVRLRTFAENDDLPVVDSLTSVWPGSNWFEREAFDLFGIVFEGHPDLRRILTDYGFIGHPFRKDFPLSGHVEMRYDPEQKRVIYQPVTIDPREVTPRIVREKNYADTE